MIKQVLVFALILVVIFSQSEPSCLSLDGQSVISIKQDSKVSLTDASLVKQSLNHYAFQVSVSGTDTYCYTRGIYKYYILSSDSTGSTVTTLAISNISRQNGAVYSATITISNDYEFVDADGVQALIIETVAPDRFLNLYENQGGVITLLTSQNINALSSQKFQKLLYFQQLPLTADNNDIVSLIQSIDESTKIVTVWAYYSVLSVNSGLDMTSPYYTFTISDLLSDIYVNCYYGLQILGTTISVYRHLAGAANLFQIDASTDLNSWSGVTTGQFTQYVLINFLDGAIGAFWDANLQNAMAVVFFANHDTGVLTNYRLELLIASNPNQIKISTDDSNSNYVILQKNQANGFRYFYILWGANAYTAKYNWVQMSSNSGGELYQNFWNAQKIYFHYTYLAKLDQSYFDTTGQCYVYTATTITKYVFVSDQWEFVKVFEAALETDLKLELEDSSQGSFEIQTDLKCSCLASTIKSFICFYGSDGCTFTVMAEPYYCQPSD